MDQRIVSTIHIAATATNDIDMTICIASSRACILKPSICIAGRRRNILNEKYRITYRIVQGVVVCLLRVVWPVSMRDPTTPLPN